MDVSRQNTRIMLFVSLVSGLLLSSVIFLEQAPLKTVLGLVFAGTGLFTMRNPLHFYFLFVFLYPLIPSLPRQIGLPDFNYHEFLFCSFAFWWSVKNIGKKGVFRQRPMAAVLGLFLLFCAFSSFLSLLRTNLVLSNIFLLKIYEKWNIFQSWSQLDSLATVRFFLDFLEGVLFFFITLDLIRTREDVSKTLRVLFGSAICVSLLGILQYMFVFRPIAPWTGQLIHIRVNSTFSDPNSLGTFLSGSFLIGIWAFLSAETTNRWKILLGNGLVFLCLIFTASRAAWAATCVTLLLLLFLTRWGRSFITWKNRSSRVISGIVSLVVVGILSGLIVGVSMTGSRLPSSESNSASHLDSILMGRVSVWKVGLRVFYEHPVFGRGVGTFPQELDKDRYKIPPLYRHENAHNYYLQILAETGLVGFVLFLFIVGRTSWESIRFLRDTSDSDTAFAVQASLGVILCVLFTSLTGHPLLLVKLQYFFWSLLALVWILVSRSEVQQYGKMRGTKILASVVAVTFLFFGPVEVNSIMKSRSVLPYEAGFYNWESDSSGIFRWTTQNARAYLLVEGKVLKVSLRQLNPEVGEKPTFVEVFMNGKVLDRIAFTNNDWKELKYYFPISTETVEIGFKPDRLFNPSRIIHNFDRRSLGIAVGPFEWEHDLLEPIGIYSEEKEDSGERLVWTRMQASFPLQKAGTTLAVPLFYNNPNAKESLSVLLYWNHDVIKETWLHNGGWQNVVLNLPDSSRFKGVLTVRVGDTWNPGRLGVSKDYRELGVGIRDFQWAD